MRQPAPSVHQPARSARLCMPRNLIVSHKQGNPKFILAPPREVTRTTRSRRAETKYQVSVRSIENEGCIYPWFWLVAGVITYSFGAALRNQGFSMYQVS